MTPDDEATAHLLVSAAFHDAAARADERGDSSIGDFSRAVLRRFEEEQRLEGALYGVVMSTPRSTRCPTTSLPCAGGWPR